MTPGLSYTSGGEDESSARIINGTGKKSEVVLLLLQYNATPKQIAPISDSIWTELCNRFMYNFSNHRPV